MISLKNSYFQLLLKWQLAALGQHSYEALVGLSHRPAALGKHWGVVSSSLHSHAWSGSVIILPVL